MLTRCPDETTQAAAHIKAAVRDIKAFRDARGYRSIPVSYCAFDSIQYRQLTADYLACPSGGDTDSSIDFFGFNVYSWCGNNSYYTSGYDKLYESFQNINIPVAVAETGCVSRDQKNRDFAAVSAMFDPVFQALFSGAVVYEWAMGVRTPSDGSRTVALTRIPGEQIRHRLILEYGFQYWLPQNPARLQLSLGRVRHGKPGRHVDKRVHAVQLTPRVPDVRWGMAG